MKLCACGRLSCVPLEAKPQVICDVLVAWVWNCECGSTLMEWRFPPEQITELITEEVA